jgi:hypothetical protein
MCSPSEMTVKALALLLLLVAPAGAVELSATACRGCHAAEHAEWQRSRHGQAWTNAIFQREYRARPLAWCVTCHAPLAEQQAEVAAHGDGALAKEGVGCLACHLREGRLVSARRRNGSPHDTLVDEDFAEPRLCARCHQFNFPRIADERVIGLTAQPMQDTIGQHARGPDADLRCISCHAARELAPARHLFPGAHDGRLLARALDVAACVDGADLRLTIVNRGAGHRVPTGDVHRHLVLRAWRPNAPERLHEEIFGRRFRPLDDGGKEEVADTTLAPRERRVLRVPLDSLGSNTDGPATVELRYVFVIDEHPGPRQSLSEPTWTTIFHTTAAPPCDR